MGSRTRYELGVNWFRDHADRFLTEVACAARLRRIRWIVIPKEKAVRARRRVDRGSLRINLFLNTQADGVNMESAEMRLCRSLKAAGTLVVEDPDDAPFYADRALQFQYLDRSGVGVPPFVVTDGWQQDRAGFTGVQRARLGANWVARSAVGMGKVRCLHSAAQYVTAALSRAGFPRGAKLLVHKSVHGSRAGGAELRFLVWYLFGHIVPCWAGPGSQGREMVADAEWRDLKLDGLADIAARIAQLSGLDWFVSELVCTRSRGRLKPLVLEPVNALAGLGPGAQPNYHMSTDVVRIAAERIVDVAWRYAHDLPPRPGTTLRLG
ncbi:MAG: hypothetical protein JXR37_20655 [Kiritimatiellae bacterium]|nr:hypothetical protein [Kiritimatiellia bacterium]